MSGSSSAAAGASSSYKHTYTHIQLPTFDFNIRLMDHIAEESGSN